MSDKLKTIDPWYAEGLRFECTECGQCCTGSPGYVWVDDQEIQAIAHHLDLDENTFRKRYLRRVGNCWSLLENQKTYDCVFLEGKRCRIYSARPKQCRTFPWWPANLKSRQAWEEAAKDCEGINDLAPVVPYEQIKKQRELGEGKRDQKIHGVANDG